MSDIRQTLNQVLAGSVPPTEFLKAVDDYLAQPDPNLDALTSLIAAAEQLGLPHEIAKAARARLPMEEVIGIGDATQVAGDDETTEIMSSGDTRMRGDPADVDADRTQITGDLERTVMTGGEDSDRTVVTGDQDRTVATTEIRRIAAGEDRTEVTGDSDATVQAAADDPFAMATPDKEEHGPGSVLKGRFRLEEVIGQGGMGAVYKAVDLLKVEARDRNPYIAVKLLVGDFKEHPEAFIALQRESAKAQRLAHPNIATVYDFDRDGETVYMTMELMVGAELAKYIKKLPAGGLPVPEANRIIEQLCAGLQYAHARGLVHSDFKPGNAFVLDDGSVKLLDFGIARASKTKADAEGESTVFDPGQLGALTPAYATIEMFEGQDPDPRDDIYALACVAYELYTGKHPFNKMSAVKAKEKNLKVLPIAKLNKRQNKVLLKALALHRADRLPSVEQLWEGLKPRKDYTLQIAGGAVAAVLLLGFLAYQPVINALHEREHAAIITEIDSGDEARLVAALAQVDTLPEARQRMVAERARARLFQYYQDRAEAAVDESAGRFEFATALAEIAMLDRYFPRDSDVLTMRQGFEQRRAELVGDLAAQFDEALADGRLMPDADAVDITDIVTRLRAADPDNDRLQSLDLANAYVALAQARIQARAWTDADRILSVGLEYAPRTADLQDRRDLVAGELRREREAALVASLRDQLSGVRPQTVADFRGIREPLQHLGELRPDDPAVRGLDNALRNTVDRGITEAAAAGEWAAADALLMEFARTLPLDALIAMRADLTAQQAQAGHVAPPNGELTERIAGVRALLADATFDDAFDRTLLAQFKELTARIGADNAQWEAVRTEIAQAYVAHAAALGDENRFGVAAAALEQGSQFHPEFAGFASQREALASARTAYEAEQARIARVQRIDRTKGDIQTEIAAGRLDVAERLFTGLRSELPADDPFIRTDAPALFVAKYVEQATAQGTTAQQAVRFAEAGLRVVPNDPQLTELRTRFQQQLAREAVVGAAGNLTAGNFAAFRTQYQNARGGLTGNAAGQFDTQVVNAVAQRLGVLDRQGEFEQTRDLRTAALQLFPNNQTLTNLRLTPPSQFAQRIVDAMENAQLTAARAVVQEGQAAEGNHPHFQAARRQLETRETEARGHYETALRERARNNTAGATEAMRAAVAIWSDNPQFEELQRQMAGRMAPQRADDGSRPCRSDLAGVGRNARATCFDMVNGQRGPVLVVIPAPEGGNAFAIGQNEVLVSDFNNYCNATRACQPIAGDAQAPLTGVTVQQADAYVAWLSETTQWQYRLPTDAEWLHAANAGGDHGNRGDFNCRVVQGGNVVKGLGLTGGATGPMNAWGVRNAIGNVQEWVRTGGTLQARGGSHQDPLSNCDLNLVRPHGGAADEVTGFRVIRNLD